MAQLLNLNDQVLVKVKPSGWAYLEAQHAIYNARTGRSDPWLDQTTHPTDADGYSKWHLWDLAHTFGPLLFMGNPDLPFESMNLIRVEKQGAA